MNKLLSLSAVTFALTMGLSAGVHAQTAPAAPAAAKDTPAKSAQQSKMASCNQDAPGKKGDERKTFMKERLSR